MKIYLVCFMVFALIGLSACQKKGEVQKAGEKLDRAIDNVKQGESPLKEKGAMEKAGESIDNTIKKDEIK